MTNNNYKKKYKFLGGFNIKYKFFISPLFGRGGGNFLIFEKVFLKNFFVEKKIKIVKFFTLIFEN